MPIEVICPHPLNKWKSSSKVYSNILGHIPSHNLSQRTSVSHFRVGAWKSGMFSDAKHLNFSISFENVWPNLQQKIASNLWAEITTINLMYNYISNLMKVFQRHVHAQHASKQHDCATSTYKVNMA